LFKGFYEIGVQVIATPYQGPALESLWWKAYPNPCQKEGALFASVRGVLRELAKSTKGEEGQNHEIKDSLTDKAIRTLAHTFICPKWHKHLDNILKKEEDVDTVVVFTVPLNHLKGLPTYIKEKHHIPIFYYDGDVPASLPQFGGFKSGFNIYQGADLTEYDGFISNSKGGVPELEKMGAKNVSALYYGADPALFAPLNVKQDIDVFFYGHGYEYRKEWIEAMITIPSKALISSRFAVRASEFEIDLGNTEKLPYVSFARLREYCCRSRINLNITRRAHASLYGSSSSRLFELASIGCCIVSNPYKGIEEWFEPQKEVFIVESAQEAIQIYEWLLKNGAERRKVGQQARKRVLREHTYQHRARELVRVLKKI
jgi:glycosyltransferase involved in cell wall biosynthesis